MEPLTGPTNRKLVLCSLEEAVRDVDQEIKREQRATHEIVRAMPAVKQEKYFSIMAASEQLLQVRGERVMLVGGWGVVVGGCSCSRPLLLFSPPSGAGGSSGGAGHPE